ncbi:hypothetical protein T439DRAFT_378878 [Meredithblackwellia eburnea MCA 4105]
MLSRRGLVSNLKLATAAARSYATPASPIDTALRTALKTAMKAKDSFKAGVIKSALADLQNASHLPSPPSPSKTLAKSIASRLDGASTFDSSTPPRPDLAEQYRNEAAILKEFVEPEPEAMDPAELDAVVKKVVEGLGLASIGGKDSGRVIKGVMDTLAGKAGGKEVSEAVKRFVMAA